MSTLQIVAIAVAGAVVLLLIIALVVSRRRRADDVAARQEGSFLDAAPTDTLAGLGKAVAPVEAAEHGPAAASSEAGSDKVAPGEVSAGTRPDEVPSPEAPQGPPAPGPRPEPLWPPASPPVSGEPLPRTALGLDWGGGAEGAAPSAAPVPVPAAAPPTDAPAEELAAAAPPTPSPSPSPPDAVATVPEQPATPTPAAEAQPDRSPATPEPPPDAGRGRKVPLSDILVTTSHKIVDLDDLEVRHMLTDLVKYEIEQATLFREQGQDVDAVLQLTEAERVTAALGMEETTQRIREMLRDIQS